MRELRRARHDRVSAWLAAREDDELAARLRAAPSGTVGVGGAASVLDVDGVPVFAKRIPITDRELAHPHSTANLFDLPTCCQYGMHRLAAPGFGAWRELAANLIVTEGVLAGGAESFAVLHHWRVLPGRAPIAPEHPRRRGADLSRRLRAGHLAPVRAVERRARLRRAARRPRRRLRGDAARELARHDGVRRPVSGR